MNLGDFTEKDYELLMEALDAWEKAPMDEGFSTSMLSSLFRKDGDPREGQIKSEMEKASGKMRSRKSVGILLRAKLELARQSVQAAGLAVPGEEEKR